MLLFCMASFSLSQTGQPANNSSTSAVSTASTVTTGGFVQLVMRHDPWERTVFVDGGLGTTGETDDHFLNAGMRLGKVLTDAHLPGLLRGQFEYAGELIPYWQAFTPKEQYTLSTVYPPRLVSTGGTYTGVSITPIILRWNLVRWHRVMPWVQGAGGLIWTNHKFPPNGSRGTSVWNFEPQFGLGLHYFVRRSRSVDFAANAVHISNASLGDANPGVNATVRFQIGYTWWK
jgi:lipid A 3-O-deacylase